jgi:hypothetical protein
MINQRPNQTRYYHISEFRVPGSNKKMKGGNEGRRGNVRAENAEMRINIAGLSSASYSSLFSHFSSIEREGGVDLLIPSPDVFSLFTIHQPHPNLYFPRPSIQTKEMTQLGLEGRRRKRR